MGQELVNSKEIKADLAALEKAADVLGSVDAPASKRLRRMAREIRENVLLIGAKKPAAPPITEFEKRLIDQR